MKFQEFKYNMMDIEHESILFLIIMMNNVLLVLNLRVVKEEKPNGCFTTLSSSPTMIYFGQEVGEPGKEDAGFLERILEHLF